MAPAMISPCTSEALHPRVDQAGAELRQIENADHQREQAGDVEEDDAAREARKALRDEELPGTSATRSGATHRREAARLLGLRSSLVRALGLGVRARVSVRRFDRARRSIAPSAARCGSLASRSSRKPGRARQPDAGLTMRHIP